jgi:tRNA pseudouridine32 synthase/23S rRNA pseudouridine746 synthase
MDSKLVFNFKSDISKLTIPETLANPFSNEVDAIAKIAASEFETYITSESEQWDYDFNKIKGKMLGVLVVQKADQSYGYLGSHSGKMPNHVVCNKCVPSIFDDSVGDYFINKGMTELSEIATSIKNSRNESEINELKIRSKEKSIALQQRLFENYLFVNLSGEKKNLLEIFKASSHGKPPCAAGECTAPKLLQYAIENKLKPIALAEFWWGKPKENSSKETGDFYPACKERCRPILEYMLEDKELYANAATPHCLRD